MSVQKLSDPPELVALCKEGEDGEEQVVGWAMVLSDRVMTYVLDSSGFDAVSYTFASLDSAEWVLGCSGIYTTRDRATVTHALDSAPDH